MKHRIFIFFITIFLLGCNQYNDTKKIEAYLNKFGFELNTLSVVCFIPADGCGSCINPSIVYSKSSSKKFLLVISSSYEKSINTIIQNNNLEKKVIIADSENLATSQGLVQALAPCYYFIESGHVVKVIDLTGNPDKLSVLKEVDKFISN